MPEVLRAELAISQAPASELVQAELVGTTEPIGPRTRQRRVVLPLMLFLLTCVSTFVAGVTGWWPLAFLYYLDPMAPADSPYWYLPLRFLLVDNWRQGVIYTGCLLTILLIHELGHFVMTLLYGVRASLPYFLPFPLSPIGTMGAVIGMDGSSANRRQIFDIGLAGPIAGLIVAAPIVWIGTRELNLVNQAPEGPRFVLPLAMRLLVEHVHPGAYDPRVGIGLNQLNAYFMAGWVGLLVTGLNMMPVSQLDGGHVTYALFGRRAHWIARLFLVLLFVYMGVVYWLYRWPPSMLLLAVLVLLMGTDHPPTRDDTARLGWLRVIVGLLSLGILVLCFVPNPIFM